MSIWSKEIVRDIRTKAKLGRYRVRGYGACRAMPHFDDIAFRIDPKRLDEIGTEPNCNLHTKIGSRFAKRPLELDIPVMVAPMSFGAVSKKVKTILAAGSALAGTASGTGEGGMLDDERAAADKLIYQLTPGRYGFSPHDLRRADAVEFYMSQGAKPGMGGQLMGAKVTEELASMRGIPAGIDLRSPSRHGDILGADDLVIKVEEIREVTNWQCPIGLKLGAGRVREDMAIAAKVGVDFVSLDGIQGGTGAGPEIILENMGIPSLAAIGLAMKGLEEAGATGEVDVIAMGGIRNGMDAAKAIALGAKAVAIGSAALIALDCISCLQCHTNRCPTGLTTQDPAQLQRLNPDCTEISVANLLNSLAREMAIVTAACGKSDVHHLSRSDLVALNPDAAAITGLPMTEKNKEPPTSSGKQRMALSETV